MELKKILLVVAMDAEENAVLDRMPKPEARSVGKKINFPQYLFSKPGHSLTLMRSGIGLVNAALAVYLALEEQDYSAVILTGVAGALSPRLDIGDILIADSIIQHDSVFSGERGNEWMAPGLPYVSLAPSARANPGFPASRALHQLIGSIEFSSPVHSGLLLSGSEFVGSPERKENLARAFPGALAVEMEAAAIATVLRESHVPFLAVKTIADRLNPDHSVSSDYNKFLAKAAAHAAELAEKLWQKGGTVA